MKTAILCSHPFAFASIELVSRMGDLTGLGAPLKEEFTPTLKALSDQVFVPMSVIDDDHGDSLQAWLDLVMPDVVFVMGFPYRIPKSLLAVPVKGFYNFHTGLLPVYRGIDPIFWQIRNGEPFGGITVHRMDGDFDSGPIAHTEKMEILPYETYGLHLQRLSALARDATAKMIEKLSVGGSELPEYGYPNTKEMPRPGFEDLLIHWESESAKSIKALVQASNPSYGGAITFYKGALLRIAQVGIHKKRTPPGTNSGTIVSVDNGLFVLCADGKSVSLDIVFSDAGLFTGVKFVHAFNIEEGELFSKNQFGGRN